MQDVWPALASAHWSPLSQRVVEALSAKAQAQGLALLSRAYSTISAAQAAAYLGVPAAQLAECTVHMPLLNVAACCAVIAMRSTGVATASTAAFGICVECEHQVYGMCSGGVGGVAARRGHRHV